MKKVSLPVLIELSKELGRLIDVFSKLEVSAYSDESKESNKDAFLEHAKVFGGLELRMCQRQCERIAGMMSNHPADISKQLSALLDRMYDESRLRMFMALSNRQAELAFPDQPLFGKEVADKFPSAAFEIDEAGKCLGLSRTTAAVFHCMRVMEIGIKATAKCLAIPDPLAPSERNWGVILRKILDDGIKKKWPKASDRMTGMGSFFEEVYASLDAVRNPWRNGTMHIENKYIDEEAEHIFTAVRGFMKKLASRVDENGEPKA